MSSSQSKVLISWSVNTRGVWDPSVIWSFSQLSFYAQKQTNKQTTMTWVDILQLTRTVSHTWNFRSHKIRLVLLETFPELRALMDLIFVYVWVLFVCLFVCFLRKRLSVYSPGCPGTHSVDQAGFELRNPPASASQVLGLKACATTAGIVRISIPA